ncbi:hypothetical protein SHIRM173S_04697 [Streptomyces hirsutus]
MVNSPVVSTEDSASGWSSPGVAQPPRIPSRSLPTVPPGLVEHPCAVALCWGDHLRWSELVLHEDDNVRTGLPRACDADTRFAGVPVTRRVPA